MSFLPPSLHPCPHIVPFLCLAPTPSSNGPETDQRHDLTQTLPTLFDVVHLKIPCHLASQIGMATTNITTARAVSQGAPDGLVGVGGVVVILFVLWVGSKERDEAEECLHLLFGLRVQSA